MTDTNEDTRIKFSEEQAKNIQVALLHAYEEFHNLYRPDMDAQGAYFYKALQDLAVSRFLEFRFESEEYFKYITAKEIFLEDDFTDIEEAVLFVQGLVEDIRFEEEDPIEVTEDLAWACITVQRMTCPFEALEIGETFFPLGNGNLFMKIAKKKSLQLPRLVLDEDSCSVVKFKRDKRVLQNGMIASEFMGVSTPKEVVDGYSKLLCSEL